MSPNIVANTLRTPTSPEAPRKRKKAMQTPRSQEEAVTQTLEDFTKRQRSNDDVFCQKFKAEREKKREFDRANEGVVFSAEKMNPDGTPQIVEDPYSQYFQAEETLVQEETLVKEETSEQSLVDIKFDIKW